MKSKLAVEPIAHLLLSPASQNSCSSWKNSVKLIIVPYISKPPTTDIAAAPPAICAECHRSVGKAISELDNRHPKLSLQGSIVGALLILCSIGPAGTWRPREALTDTHNHKEACEEPPKINHS